MVKEEPMDEMIPISLSGEPNDELIASYDIIPVNNPKYKLMSVSGLSNVLSQNSNYGVSKRTDSKEIKIELNQGDPHSVCYTKEANFNLGKSSYAIKLSEETGQAYFIPIASMHSISFFDESKKSFKVDSANKLHEDNFKMPHPSRNRHDQLCIEMKNRLYKPLNRIEPEQEKSFFLDLFTSSLKRQANKP